MKEFNYFDANRWTFTHLTIHVGTRSNLFKYKRNQRRWNNLTGWHAELELHVMKRVIFVYTSFHQ